MQLPTNKNQYSSVLVPAHTDTDKQNQEPVSRIEDPNESCLPNIGELGQEHFSCLTSSLEKIQSIPQAVV